MSYSIEPLGVVKLMDPRLNWANPEAAKTYGIVSGASYLTCDPRPSTSFNQTNWSWSVPPPSPQTAVDCRVQVIVPVTVSFTGTAAVGNNLLQDGFDAFRFAPIASIISTITAKINTGSINLTVSEVIPYMLRYNTDLKDREYDYSTFPSYMDQFQNYEDGFGSVRSELASYPNNNFGTPRGAFPYTSVTNTPTTASVSANICEPLWVSPFIFGHGSQKKEAFIGVQSMDIQINLIGNLARIWSHSNMGGSTLTSINVTFQQPTLLFQYLTPKILDEIPSLVPYSQMVLQYFSSTISNKVYYDQPPIQIQSQSIQLNSVPRSMYLFAKLQSGVQTFNTTDCFLSLLSLSINYNNVSGILASASQFDLYNIAKRNGCQLSWPQWSGTSIPNANILQSGQMVIFGNSSLGPAFMPIGGVGSILRLDFGIDIGLPANVAPGLLYNANMQVTATFKQINPLNISAPIPPAVLLPADYTFFIVTITEGTFTITNLQGIQEQGVISKEDVLDAQSRPGVAYASQDNIYGGDFLPRLKNFFNKVRPYLKTGFEVAKKAAPYVLPLLEGLGNKPRRGGKMLSRNDLRHRLM